MNFLDHASQPLRHGHVLQGRLPAESRRGAGLHAPKPDPRLEKPAKLGGAQVLTDGKGRHGGAPPRTGTPQLSPDRNSQVRTLLPWYNVNAKELLVRKDERDL